METPTPNPMNTLPAHEQEAQALLHELVSTTEAPHTVQTYPHAEGEPKTAHGIGFERPGYEHRSLVARTTEQPHGTPGGAVNREHSIRSTITKTQPGRVARLKGERPQTTVVTEAEVTDHTLDTYPFWATPAGQHMDHETSKIVSRSTKAETTTDDRGNTARSESVKIHKFTTHESSEKLPGDPGGQTFELEIKDPAKAARYSELVTKLALKGINEARTPRGSDRAKVA